MTKPLKKKQKSVEGYGIIKKDGELLTKVWMFYENARLQLPFWDGKKVVRVRITEIPRSK